MQVCISLQTDNYASTPPLSFLQAGCPSCRPTNSVKALKAKALKHCSYKYVNQFVTAIIVIVVLLVCWWMLPSYENAPSTSVLCLVIGSCQDSVKHTHTICTHTHVLRPFFCDYPGQPVPERKKQSGFY